MASESGDPDERKEVARLRKALTEDFTKFLLNNILMSVQFFKHYERDIEALKESSLKEVPLKCGRFKTFAADGLHALVGSNMHFGSGEKGKEGISKFSNPTRTYVTYGNVQTKYNLTLFSQQDTSLEYKLIVQPCAEDTKDLSGYVNLIEHESPEPEEGNDSPDFIPQLDTVGHPSAGRVHQSGVVVGKNDNFYYVDLERRSKPILLSEYRTRERITFPGSIPRSCFQEREKRSLAREKRRTGLFKEREQLRRISDRVLLSAAFKRHFSEVFIAKLSSCMGFHEVADLTRETFHWDHVSVTTSRAVHHITPALEFADWPHCATDFAPLPDTGRKKWTEWPTGSMQEQVKAFGCSLVPVGYFEGSDTKNDYTLEWKMDFPRAESYLMTRMMHTHVRCYLFTFLLYKSFIEIEGCSHDFGPSHIINHLFLLVRKNFLGWPEYNQGESLLRFLSLLQKTIEDKDAKYFFIHKRNLYANSSLRVLHKAHYILEQVIRNPIPYILKTLSQLKYKKDFFPELDYVDLYNVLVAKNVDDYRGRKTVDEEVEKSKSRKKTAKEKAEDEENRKVKPILEDTILSWESPPSSSLRSEVLAIFIGHFINVGNACCRYEDYDHAMLYLIHARRLVVLLSEVQIVRGKVQEFENRIRNAITRCTRRQLDKDVPREREHKTRREATSQRKATEEAEDYCTSL